MGLRSRPQGRPRNGTRISDASCDSTFRFKGAQPDLSVCMAILPGCAKTNVFAAEQQQLLDLFANQTALAIESTLSQNAADDARMHMQTEEMRSSLLSAVSHDLRTPLASITGAASTLRSQGEKLPPEMREELLESISDEADAPQPPGGQSAGYDAP